VADIADKWSCPNCGLTWERGYTETRTEWAGRRLGTQLAHVTRCTRKATR
jgi:hypothetical protein